jgi:hypothetical protein
MTFEQRDGSGEPLALTSQPSWDVDDIARHRYTIDDLVLTSVPDQDRPTPPTSEALPINPQLRKIFLGETGSNL